MAGRIIVDTAKLASYSTRIQRVVNRLWTLNRRIRSLYYTGTVSGLYYFIQYNRFYSAISALDKAKRYLDKTRNDFDWIEHNFSTVDPLKFTPAQGRNIRLNNATDHRDGFKTSIKVVKDSSTTASVKSICKKIKQLVKDVGNFWDANNGNSSLKTIGLFITAGKIIAEEIELATSSINTENEYTETSGICGEGAHSASSSGSTPKSKIDVFLEELKNNYGWNDVLKGSAHIGKIYGLITGLKEATSVEDYWKIGNDTYDFLNEAVSTFKNYRKIGNAVGTKTSMTWWAKNITGIKSVGRVSTAKNVFTRFKNNLTNKTSPFNMQLKKVADTFTGKQGVGKAVAAWAGVALDGVMNFFSNKDEQKAAGGTMSDGRVWAETITETAVNTVFTYGATIVAGAAISAVMGTVGAPALLVTAASGLVVAGVNAGVKAITGKTATEFVSDSIIDGAKSKIDKVNLGVKALTGKSATKWVSDACSVIGNTAKQVFSPAASWAKNLSS